MGSRERPMHLPGLGDKREVHRDVESANKRARRLSTARSTHGQLQERENLERRIKSLAEKLEQMKAQIRQKSLSTPHPATSSEIPGCPPTAANVNSKENGTVSETDAANSVEWPSFSSKPAYKSLFLFSASASQDDYSASSQGGFESVAYSSYTSQPARRKQRFQRSGSRAGLPMRYGDSHPVRRASSRSYNSRKGSIGLGMRARALSNASGNSGTAFLRTTDRKHHVRELEPGSIISAPHHTQARSGSVSTNSRNMSFSEFGAIHSKYRKMIILETWGEHCICLPLYSYRGKGLKGRRDIAEEYISVRDDSETFWDREPSESSAGVLTAVRDPSWPMSRTFITGRTVVKLTEKIVHSYTDSCSVEGHLNHADFRKMYKIYMEAVKLKENEILGSKPHPKQREEELEEGEILG